VCFDEAAVQTITLQKWAVDNEPDLTREAYALIECGGTEDCGCEACFNFATTRHLVYSAEVLEFLEWLGIDPCLEACAHHDARLATGDHCYTVSFFLVGRIASGPATPVAARRGRLCESLERAGDVEVGFCADASDAPDAFRGLPCVRLEVRVVAPWVANGDEPIGPN
jgi:hypothetical protein